MNGYKLPKPTAIEQKMIEPLERISKDEKFLLLQEG